jgi:type I restriction enzyme S subunit
VAPELLASLLVAARSELALRSNGTTFQELSTDSLRSLRLPLPPENERRSITYVLERETTRIDALIAKKTRLIELLKEKRQALITRAVTKGLDPKVKMKNSGVEWIGEVPEHWLISKLGYEATEQGGKTPSTDNPDYWGGDVPWVSPKDMKVDVISTSIDKITDVAVQECGMALISANAVLAVVRGMILAHSFPVAETARAVTINQDMKALVPSQRLYATYLRLILQSAKSYVVSVLIAEAAHGTRVLRTDIWKQLPVVLPPQSEQSSIIKHVARTTERFDSLISKTKHSIDLIKERRSALITAAVTGQIDLRGAL